MEEEASSLPLPFFLRGRDSHEIRSGAEEEEKAAEAEPEKEDNNAVRVRPLRSLPWLPLAAACDATQPLWKSNCLLPIPTFPPSLPSIAPLSSRPLLRWAAPPSLATYAEIRPDRGARPPPIPLHDDAFSRTSALSFPQIVPLPLFALFAACSIAAAVGKLFSEFLLFLLH